MRSRLPPHRADDPLPRTALIKIPRQPRSVGMVHDILDAGMAVIVEDGLEAMTTNRVAERAGVSIGSLYQYFANRESILAGIIERSQLDVTRRLRGLQGSAADLPLEPLLRMGLTMMLRYYDPHLPVVRRIIQEAPLLADNSVLRLMESALADLVRDRLLAEPRYRLRHGQAGLHVAINTLLFLYLHWLAHPHPLVTEAAFIDALVHQVMAGIEEIP